MKQDYKSDVILGDKYRDEQTGLTGVATAIAFYQFACERVTLEFIADNKIEEFTFDAPRLTHLPSEEKVQSDETGGPDRGPMRRGSIKR